MKSLMLVTVLAFSPSVTLAAGTHAGGHDHIRDHQPQHHWHQNARGDVEEPPQHQRQHDAQRDVQKGRWCGGRRGLCHDDPEALSLSG